MPLSDTSTTCDRDNWLDFAPAVIFFGSLMSGRMPLQAAFTSSLRI